MKLHLQFINDELKKSGGKFLVGSELTAADIMMSFPGQVSLSVSLLDIKNERSWH